MDVDIGEVQAQVESDAPSAPSSERTEGGKGPTEQAHEQELARRRAERLRARLHAD